MKDVIRVLLIDDDEDDFIITRDLLSDIKEIQYELDWVGNFEDGLEIIKKELHHVYLIDYYLGVKDGLQLIQQALVNGIKKPFIMLTGQGNRELDFKAMQLGAADYLVKGQLNTEVLERSIRYALKTNQANIEKRDLEKLLFQAQKMESIGTLAGGIAHDFNNILFPILGYVEMLLEDVPEDSPSRGSLEQIYTSALRAKSLVKQILTFARQESSELMLMKIQPIVKEALKLIRSTIPTTIEIKQDINPDCGVIKADPTQIHQIVMNLATNAYHAMEETGGELKVSLKEMEFGALDLINPDMVPGIYACLIVADTGVGMDKNLIDKIFDPFFTTKTIGRGTGMGLSVVHGIVTAMGSAIHVYSEPGKGTEFHVYLPVEKNLSEEQVIHSTAPIQGGTEQILLVDDEEVILIMEKRMLERLGYQVTSRTSSLEALEAFRANPDKFDLIITDMAMPNMPGDKLSAELTKIRPGIFILLCTGFSQTMSEEKAALMGIKGFLFKPIVMKDLARKIRDVLDKKLKL
jgi:signal transduction histidine kinase